MSEQEIADYLRRWPGLFERRDGVVVDAPPEDVDVARSYPRFPDKGPQVSGMRLTVMSRRLTYLAGEEVRVVHAVEFVEPGRNVYVMGPKPVYGEYVDDVLATTPPPEDVWEPSTYNGPILSSPAVDYNYDITVYRFDQVGKHHIQWRIGTIQSNVLTLEAVP
jgi:hypothetical protein